MDGRVEHRLHQVLDALGGQVCPDILPEGLIYRLVVALQELVQRESGQVLAYQLVGEEGPDHDKRFFVEVDLNGTPVGSGQGRSKKEAEQAAAHAAIACLQRGE